MNKEIIISENDIKTIKLMSLEECVVHFERAVMKWSHGCYKTVRHCCNNIMEYDDFYSEGMLCLMNVYEKYKPINTFNTALHKSLDNLKIDIIRKLNTQKRTVDQPMVSFDTTLLDGDLLSDIEGDYDCNFELFEFNEDIVNALSKLTEEERKIANFLLNQESTKKVLAEELNISRPTLDSRIEKVRDKVVGLLPEYIPY